MNNAVSADVTLFSRVHPDIVKRISVSSVIVSALLAIGGIGAFVTSLRMGDATSTMSMVFMTVGTILILTALFRLFWRSKEWVYTPTGSVTKEGSCFFDVCDLHVLTARLDKKTFGKDSDVQVKSNGNVRMDYLISHDKRFAAVQLFRFIPYTYEAASSVYYLTGQDALAFTRCLETNKF